MKSSQTPQLFLNVVAYWVNQWNSNLRITLSKHFSSILNTHKGMASTGMRKHVLDHWFKSNCHILIIGIIKMGTIIKYNMKFNCLLLCAINPGLPIFLLLQWPIKLEFFSLTTKTNNHWFHRLVLCLVNSLKRHPIIVFFHIFHVDRWSSDLRRTCFEYLNQ